MTLFASDVPPSWDTILHEVQLSAPEAFIGGGALRDLDNGRPFKDLDIFLPTHRFSPMVSYRLYDRGYFKGPVSPMAYIGSDPSVVESREYTPPSPSDLYLPPVNLILLNDSYELPEGLERFDLGVCQIAYDGNQVFWTDAYTKDVENRTMTVCRASSEGQLERTRQRHQRISEKYKNWPMIIPDEFLNFLPQENMVFTLEDLGLEGLAI